MITTYILIVLILYGALSVPFWLLLFYQAYIRRGRIYRVTVKGKYQNEFEQLLRNIINTQTKYYGDKIKVDII